MWSSTCAWPMRSPARAFGSRYGALVIDSMPPATMTSAFPVARMSCASIAAFMPEPHILLTVVQPVASGKPAPSAAWRAGACPCPAGSTQPISTSCTSSGRSFARSTAARMAPAASSGAAKFFSSPWNAPIGVRAQPTMTMGSLCMRGSSDVVLADQFFRAAQQRRGQRTGLAGLQIHRDTGEHADRGDLTARRMAHLVHELCDLVPDFEERRSHGDRIARVQLALIGDVLLHGRHAELVLPQVGGRCARRGEQVPGRLVELADIPHHVHVPHV